MSGNRSATLSVGGACKGTVEVASLDCSVNSLRRSIASAFGLSAEESSGLKIISSGKNLTEPDKLLSQYGVTPRTKLLLLKGKKDAAVADLHEAEEKAAHLERLKVAAAAMASRSDDQHPDDSVYSFEVENQTGEGLALTEGDRKALGMGLAMHSKGQRTLKKAAYKDSLQELLLAEEAFQLTSSDLLQHVDNLALLMIDIVWCFYKLQDASSLATAQQRLQSARKILQKSHGPNLERLRVLHGDFSPELAMYIRLELLEGVVAFHSSNKPLALQQLRSAQAKWERLQVSDTSLASLAAAGFSTKEATRALRFCQGDVERAAHFALQQRDAAKDRKKKKAEAEERMKEQRSYGRTPAGKRVNMDRLEQLSSLGYAKALVAQALFQTENEAEAALDLLTNPNSQELLQQALSARSTLGKRQREDDCREDLKGMGFPEAKVNAAIMRLGGSCDMQAALDMLVSGELGEIPLSGNHQRGEVFSGITGDEEEPDAKERTQQGEDALRMDVDHEAEYDLARGLKGDPLSAYDVDVVDEGLAIQEYLSLLASD